MVSDGAFNLYGDFDDMIKMAEVGPHALLTTVTPAGMVHCSLQGESKKVDPLRLSTIFLLGLSLFA